MKSKAFASRAAALLLLIATVEASKHGHFHQRRHQHSDAEAGKTLEKRSGQCQFPTDAGLVAITPNEKNAGWAMSPDQECLPGHYCPYACPPGQLSMQWDPKATSYSYPMSMNGGLYCDEDGNIQKPFPDRPYCKDGTGAVTAVNKCSGQVSFCQTVLPGNEAMLIPTLVQDVSQLAVPDTSYWCEAAAHFYINPPGIGPETACAWGTSANSWGNWAPYVAGANTDGDGNTFVKLGWNPVYLEPSTPFRDVMPDYGVEIECEGGGCNGLPCKIDPAENGVNEVTGSSGGAGAGGGKFCVVTVPPGGKAKINVFEKAGSRSSSTSSTPTPTPSSTSSSSSSTSTSTSTLSSKTSSTSTSTATSTSTSSSKSSSSSTSSSSSASKTSSSKVTPSSSKTTKSSSSSRAAYSYLPHVFVENTTATFTPMAVTAAAASPTAVETSKAVGAATTTTASILGLTLSVLIAGALLNF
ncbi:putative SUN domain protein [Thermoascus aurantiacus ATCC 26904]